MGGDDVRPTIEAVTPRRSHETVASVSAETSREELAAWLRLHPDVDRVVIVNGHDRVLPDLEMLRGQRMRSVTINAPEVRDWSALESLGPNLRHLQLRVGGDHSIDLANLVGLQSLSAAHRLVAPSLSQATTLRRLSLRRFDMASLADLAGLIHLHSLSLMWCPHLVSLRGLPRTTPLDSIHIFDAPALRDLAGLPSSLEMMDVQGCRAWGTTSPLQDYRNLRSLEIGDCGDIDSLAPLSTLALDNLAVWGKTNVVDGDLEPILHMAALASFRMDGKRHYRPRVQAVRAYVARQARDPSTASAGAAELGPTTPSPATSDDP